MTQEQAAPMQFGNLSPMQATKVVLAELGGKGPVTASQVMKYAGVRFSELEPDAKAGVRNVFEEDGVERIEDQEGGTPHYTVSSERQGTVYQEVGIDRKIVATHIANAMHEELLRRFQQ